MCQESLGTKNRVHFGGGVALKALSIAALAGLVSVGAGAGDAVKAAEVDSSANTTLGENSAYTLTKVDAAGTNTITKYSYNNETGLTEAINYEVGLKQTTYGTGSASKTFNVNLINAPVTITAKYDTSNQKSRLNNSSNKIPNNRS